MAQNQGGILRGNACYTEICFIWKEGSVMPVIKDINIEALYAPIIRLGLLSRMISRSLADATWA